MDVNLEIFTFQSISFTSVPAHMVDWAAVDKEMSDDHNSEIVFLHHDINGVEDGFEITIHSNINIPNSNPNPVFKGTYNRYESNSMFFTEHTNITDSVVAELALSHLSNCYKLIFTDTYDKTNGQEPYMIQIPSVSKLILMVESDGRKSN